MDSDHSLCIGVKTTQTLEGIQAQILQNVKDFDAAVAANVAAGAAGGIEGASAISGAWAFSFHFSTPSTTLFTVDMEY